MPLIAPRLRTVLRNPIALIIAVLALLASALALPASLPYEMFEKHGAVMLLIEPASGQIVDANDAAALFYGYEKSRLRELKISDINALAPSEVAAERQRAARENRNYFVFPHRLADGSLRTVEVYSWPIDVEGRKLLFSIIHDASDRKLAEDELVRYKGKLEELVAARTREIEQQTRLFYTLSAIGLLLQLAVIVYLVITIRRRRVAEREVRDSEELFRNYFQHSLVGMAITSPETGWVHANQALCDMLGYTLDELRATDWPSLTHPDDLAADMSQYQRMMSGAIPGYSLEKRFIRKDGQVVDTILSVRLIEHDDGRPAQVLAQLQDITARHKAEHEVHELNSKLEARVRQRTEELEKALTELETFSYSASHDLRSPLRSINGYAHILAEDEPNISPEGRQMLHRIRTGAERMGQLIDEILQFSRLRQEQIGDTAIDIAAQVEGIVATLRSEHPEVRFEIGALPSSHGDATMIGQVWSNLIGNAVKYSSKVASPHIEIGARENGREVEYFVRDNGAGFDMTYVDKLFNVFQRLHNERDFPGTGAGLAIVKRIVARHGGRVWAEGAENQGATFHFTLPRA